MKTVVTCGNCNHNQLSDKVELPYNWKCDQCGKVQPYDTVIDYNFKSPVGTAKRRKDYNKQ